VELEDRKRALQSIIILVIIGIAIFFITYLYGRTKTVDLSEISRYERAKIEITLEILYSDFEKSTSINACRGVIPFQGITGSKLQIYDETKFMVYDKKIPTAFKISEKTCFYKIIIDRLPGLKEGKAFYQIIFPVGPTKTKISLNSTFSSAHIILIFSIIE
jgi:hypothetical protein